MATVVQPARARRGLRARGVAVLVCFLGPTATAVAQETGGEVPNPAPAGVGTDSGIPPAPGNTETAPGIPPAPTDTETAPGPFLPPGTPVTPEEPEGGGGTTFRIIPALALGEAYNDNVTLAPRGSEVYDFITTITPSLTLSDTTPRFNFNLTYDPQELIFDRGTFAPVLQERLLGVGHAEVWPEYLFFDARASIDQEFLKPTGPIGPSTLTTNGNLQTVNAAEATPYLREHFGTFANSETRYTFSDVTVSGNTIAPEEINQVLQKFISGEYFGRLSWTATGELIDIDRLTGTADPLGGTTSKDEFGKLEIKYPIIQEVSIIGSGGYERITDPTLTVQPEGPTWSGGLAYDPTPYFSAFASYGRRIDQTDVEAKVAYTPDPDFQIRGIYTLTFQTSQSALAASLNEAVVGPGGTLINGTTGQPFVAVTNGTPGTASSAFGVESGSFFQTRGELDVTATRERNTYTLAAYDIKDSGASSAVTSERIIGGTIAWQRKVWPNLTLKSDAAYYRALFQDGSGRIDNSYTLAVGLEYNISAKTSAGLVVTRLDTISNAAAESLINDIVLVTISKQF
jgi:uncharacterized protein (PEP-CTERM system associated)